MTSSSSSSPASGVAWRSGQHPPRPGLSQGAGQVGPLRGAADTAGCSRCPARGEGGGSWASCTDGCGSVRCVVFMVPVLCAPPGWEGHTLRLSQALVKLLQCSPSFHTLDPHAATSHFQADGGLADVTDAERDLLDGRWRLLYTSRPGTASPIRNTFTVSCVCMGMQVTVWCEGVTVWCESGSDCVRGVGAEVREQGL